MYGVFSMNLITFVSKIKLIEQNEGIHDQKNCTKKQKRELTPIFCSSHELKT